MWLKKVQTCVKRKFEYSYRDLLTPLLQFWEVLSFHPLQSIILELADRLYANTDLICCACMFSNSPDFVCVCMLSCVSVVSNLPCSSFHRTFVRLRNWTHYGIKYVTNQTTMMNIGNAQSDDIDIKREDCQDCIIGYVCALLYVRNILERHNERSTIR